MENIKKFIRESLNENDVFDSVMTKIVQHRDKPAHSLAELKEKNTKLVGDLFEAFCVLYLQAQGYNARLISEIPLEELATWQLKSKDVGIDIVAIKDNEVCAVQCKYRSKTVDRLKRTVHRVTWRDLSTFLALCAVTGPWTSHIVMTNADFVTRHGHRSTKDKTIAKQKFTSTTKDVWNEMCKLTSQTPSLQPDTMIQTRTLRQNWLDKLSK
jgi:predicted helicase